MLIKDLGGEFALIDRIKTKSLVFSENVVVGIGDDTAVLENSHSKNSYLLVTADTLVENKHFNKLYCSPYEIGIKSVECNVSDIAAMGGYPTCALISIVLNDETHVEWVDELYRGMAETFKKYKVSIIGGDTTCGPKEVISITLLGEVLKENLSLRSGAQDGDLVVTTGTLGASKVCLELIKKKLIPSHYLLKKHKTPRSRMDIVSLIAPYTNSMIDISDGLSSEINHISQQSGLGAIIYSEKIPLHRDTIKFAKILKKDPMEMALYGGEDYELLFTISKEKLKKLENVGIMNELFIIGEISAKLCGCFLEKSEGVSVPLEGGFNHFIKK